MAWDLKADCTHANQTGIDSRSFMLRYIYKFFKNIIFVALRLDWSWSSCCLCVHRHEQSSLPFQVFKHYIPNTTCIYNIHLTKAIVTWRLVFFAPSLWAGVSNFTKTQWDMVSVFLWTWPFPTTCTSFDMFWPELQQFKVQFTLAMTKAYASVCPWCFCCFPWPGQPHYKTPSECMDDCSTKQLL